jgi:TfoX/Sxy family transcriptional regulator of competence genes
MVYRPLRYEQIMRAADGLDVRARRMFEGMAIYSGEKMFAYLAGEEVGLKLAPQDMEEALKMEGASPLVPSPNAAPMKEYVQMPRMVLDNHDQFVTWVQRSASYANGRALV